MSEVKYARKKNRKCASKVEPQHVVSDAYNSKLNYSSISIISYKSVVDVCDGVSMCHVYCMHVSI